MKKTLIEVAGASVGMVAVGLYVWHGAEVLPDDQKRANAAGYVVTATNSLSDSTGLIFVTENVTGNAIRVSLTEWPSISLRPRGTCT